MVTKWSNLKMPGFVGLYFFAWCFCFGFLLKNKKNWKPLSISFSTYTRTICQDYLGHKSFTNSTICVRLQAEAQKMQPNFQRPTFLSFNIMYVFIAHWKDYNFRYSFFMIYYTCSNMIKNLIFSHFSNTSLGNLVLSGSVWSGKRRLPKDGPPTSFAKRMTPSWQECAMCILSKHQHQFNWEIEAQFLITFNPGLSTLRLFSALQLLDQP